MGKDIHLCVWGQTGDGSWGGDESGVTAHDSLLGASAQLTEKQERGCPWLKARQAQGKDMPPDKEIKMNPNYWILSASCNDLNREG